MLDVIRDIARGGLSGIIVGLLVGGIGGRLVMRLATIRHEDAVGIFTDNGEVIGHITINGTLALMVFGGMGMGFVAGTIWVIVRPWLPETPAARAITTAVAAVAIGTPTVIQRTNPDFVVLRHDPVVVALLIGLVGLTGLSIAVVDGALDARLPRPVGPGGAAAAYTVIALAGLVLILPAVVSILLAQSEYDAAIRLGWALAVVGACTAAWWALRANGRSAPPIGLRIVATGALVAAVALGVVTSLPHVLRAAGAG
jgi:hypothetical protein